VRTLSARLRFGCQFAAALVAVLSDLTISRLALPYIGPVELGFIGTLLTIFWVLGCTNAVNFMDGLDGAMSAASSPASCWRCWRSRRAGST
jgi:UDP-GlcNAc:undecaprenyl-phosphate GlcNAc-1-phosphate transferase